MKRAMSVAGRLAILAALLAAAWGSARAQDTTGNVEQRIRPPAAPPTLPVPLSELLLTGRDDLVVLQPKPLFTLHADLGWQFTSNAALANSNPMSDNALMATTGLRASTVIDQRYTIFAGLDYQGARYDQNQALDFDSLAASLGTEIPVGAYLVDFAYTLTDVHASGWGRDLLTQNDLNLTVRRPFNLSDRLVIVPALSLARDNTTPDAFQATSVRGGATLVYALSATLSFTAQTGVYYRAYDNYFQNVTGIERDDTGGDFSAALTWTPLRNLTVSGSLGMAVNRSNLPSSSYNALTFAPMVNAHFTF